MGNFRESSSLTVGGWFTMTKSYVISNTPRYAKWKGLFTYFIQNGHSCKATFPGDEKDQSEGFLTKGKKSFLSLQDVTVTKSNGIGESIEVRARLNEECKALLLSLQEPSFAGHMPELWSFEISSPTGTRLKVEDFTVCLLELDDLTSATLRELGFISSPDVEEIVP